MVLLFESRIFSLVTKLLDVYINYKEPLQCSKRAAIPFDTS